MDRESFPTLMCTDPTHKTLPTWHPNDGHTQLCVACDGVRLAFNDSIGSSPYTLSALRWFTDARGKRHYY